MIGDTLTGDAVSAWCREHLGSSTGQILFTTGNLARVFGLRLIDGREVVVKIRPAQARQAGCAAVQRHLHRAGFPCPEPLAGPAPLNGTAFAGDSGGDFAVNAETLIRGGAPYPPDDGPDRAQAFAELLARFVGEAPTPDQVPDLVPPPAWIDWDHCLPGHRPLRLGVAQPGLPRWPAVGRPRLGQRRIGRRVGDRRRGGGDVAGRRRMRRCDPPAKPGLRRRLPACARQTVLQLRDPGDLGRRPLDPLVQRQEVSSGRLQHPDAGRSRGAPPAQCCRSLRPHAGAAFHSPALVDLRTPSPRERRRAACRGCCARPRRRTGTSAARSRRPR